MFFKSLCISIAIHLQTFINYVALKIKLAYYRGVCLCIQIGTLY